MFADKGKYFQINNLEKYKITAVYTTKEIGDIDILFKDREKSSENIEKYFGKKNSVVVYAKQSHTDNIVFITDETDKYFYEDVDGFITKRKDIVLMTQYADCLPVFLYDKVNDIIGVCHSGWKGSFKGIGIKAVDMMNEKYGSKSETIIFSGRTPFLKNLVLLNSVFPKCHFPFINLKDFSISSLSNFSLN